MYLGYRIISRGDLLDNISSSLNFSKLKPIRDVIYESLRQAIFDGKLKAGERLIESELAKKMNVSRTPVREAIRMLETEGLAKHIPRRGAVVKGFTREEIIEIYSIRIALEALAIIYTVENITDIELQKLKHLIKKMRELTDQNDTKRLFETCEEFNKILIDSCKMPRLIKLINTYQEYLRRFRAITMRDKQRKVEVQKDHEDILNSVMERDKEKAEKIVREHLKRALEAYLENFPDKRYRES